MGLRLNSSQCGWRNLNILPQYKVCFVLISVPTHMHSFPQDALRITVQTNKAELWCIRFASKLNQTQYKGVFKGDNMLDKSANACKLDLSRRQLLNSAEEKALFSSCHGVLSFEKLTGFLGAAETNRQRFVISSKFTLSNRVFAQEIIYKVSW